jgi:sulfur carrier protein
MDAHFDIDIDVNGEAQRVPAACTLAALLERLELAGQPLALAVNRTVVPRQQWAAHRIAAQDRIDIVRAIGGG